MIFNARFLPFLSGIALCCGIALGAFAIEHIEAMATGRAWIESLVLAVLIGTAIRTFWTPPTTFTPGIQFASKTLLEIAVMLMGATISFGAMLSVGVPLLVGIIVTVIITIFISYAIGRASGLPNRMAILIACGNAICGNSAIAAVAPVINAKSDDVATSIAFTAVLGIAVVLLLPIAAGAFHLSAEASGVLAGLTVYAVPQVIAAAAPMGATAVQVGTLVKLVRVLMLGPVVMTLSLLKPRTEDTAPARRVSITQLLPGFILAFLALAALRSLGWLPDNVVEVAHHTSVILTIIAMAGLGLGVDLRNVSAAGPRVSITVIASLIVLGLIALAVIHLAGLA